MPNGKGNLLDFRVQKNWPVGGDTTAESEASPRFHPVSLLARQPLLLPSFIKGAVRHKQKKRAPI
jgi:hypothetical protein